MKSRILKIRKESKLTQDAFAEKLNLSKNFVWMLEKGERVPSDRTISDICREFKVNEEWLRTGRGKMYTEAEDETASIVSDLLEENNPVYDVIKSIMKTYKKLEPKSQKVIENFAKELLEEIKKGG